jgi:opacity protein-like surface antigen
MKKKMFPLIVLFVMSVIALQAQTEKGKLFASGAFRFELNTGGENIKSDDSPDNKYGYYDIDFQPKVGYTVINNMPIGLFIDVDYYREKAKDDDDLYKEITFSIGPFIRYYFYDFHGLKPYAEGLIGIGMYKDKYKSGGSDDWDDYKESYFTFRMGGGLSYFFNDNVAVDLFLGYNHESYTHKDDVSSDREEIKTKYNYNEFLLQIGVVIMLPL